MSAVIKETQISRPVAQFMANPKKLLIDGKWLPAASGMTFEVKNPATGATIARTAEGDKADIDAAVRAARRAFESGPWPAMTPSERAKVVWRIGDLISKYTDELAELESLDRSEEHTSELQSQSNLVCRLLLEKKKQHERIKANQALL